MSINWLVEKSLEIERKKEYSSSVEEGILDTHKKIGILEKISRTTGRPLEFYIQLLELELSDFDNKEVLNIWSWKSDLDRDLELLGIKSKVLVNVDFAYNNIGSNNPLDYITWKHITKNNIPNNAISADMRKLPLIENQFDNVLSLWSIVWLPKKERYLALKEAYRVCKNWWKIKVYPVTYSKKLEFLAKKYPFLEFSTPMYDSKKILSTGVDDIERFLGKIMQYYSNFDWIIMEKYHKLKEKIIKGNDVSLLTITKNPNVSLKEFELAIKELDDAWFVF